MKMIQATSVEQFKLVSSFESLRKTLLQEKYADRLKHPIAYWALPGDRRLPLALLGRTVNELLHTPFTDLSATPGIGTKKINSLIKLLSRATKDEPPGAASDMAATPQSNGSPVAPAKRSTGGQFRPEIVSEALWAQWCETVKKAGLADEMLGRLAPTLRVLPTVIWHTPLSTYIDRTLAEIRDMKTHGEKRVRVIMEVFHTVDQLFAGTLPEKINHLSVRLTPKFTLPIQQWIEKKLEANAMADPGEVRAMLTLPLLSQLRIDVSDEVADLAESRLGVGRSQQTVRMLARGMSVTRARVYQLLDDCGKVMDVRWPEGRPLVRSLVEKYHCESVRGKNLQFLEDTSELFYPK